jgi:hypothetical protein
VATGESTLTLTPGANVTIVGYSGNNTVVIDATGGGGGSLSGNLAGNIFANGFAITSTGNGNVILTADGTGVVNTSKQKMLTYAETVNAFGNATGTITPDINQGSIQTMTLTGNITFSSIGNIAAGQSAVFIMTQDATGNRILTSTMKFAGNLKTLSTTGNSIDVMSVFYDGSTYYSTLTTGYV